MRLDDLIEKLTKLAVSFGGDAEVWLREGPHRERFRATHLYFEAGEALGEVATVEQVRDRIPTRITLSSASPTDMGTR